ncbi:MAG TPA: abortive infection family protein [Blastocatellia bacterium]
MMIQFSFANTKNCLNALASYAFIREWLGESANPTVRIQSLNWKYVKEQYEKAMVRLEDGDTASTVTIAKSILEAVCRHILDSVGSSYDHKENLLRLCGKACESINLSRRGDRQAESRIISGCKTIVQGIAEMRNAMGDAHGHGKNDVVAERRHAKLALDAASTAASFLIDTYRQTNARGIEIPASSSIVERPMLSLVFSADNRDRNEIPDEIQ